MGELHPTSERVRVGSSKGWMRTFTKSRQRASPNLWLGHKPQKWILPAVRIPVGVQRKRLTRMNVSKIARSRELFSRKLRSILHFAANLLKSPKDQSCSMRGLWMRPHHLRTPLCSRKTVAGWINWWIRGQNRRTGKVPNPKKHRLTKSTVPSQGKRRCRVSYMSGLWTGVHSALTRSWSTETRSSHTGVKSKIGKARLEILERQLLGSQIWIQVKNWKEWPY